jgi:hypothetical protein
MNEDMRILIVDDDPHVLFAKAYFPEMELSDDAD